MNKAIVKENLKRFWPISFAAFIAYFMCGPFYLLQTRNDSTYGLLQSAVSTSNIGYAFVTCIMTVAVAAAVYAYLFKVNSTVFMHSVPVTRLELFTSSAASGLILSFIPVAMNGIVMIALKLSGKFDGYFRSGSEFRVAEMWNVKSIISWMIVVFVEIFFIFAICALSAVISGNSVINVLTSCGLNLLTTLVYLSAVSYASSFLFGFGSASVNEDIMHKMHPVLNYAVRRSSFGNEELVVSDLGLLCYILVGVAIFAASYWIYTKRPNEKAGDSYVFEIVNVIISVLMVYMGASCIGLIFEQDMGFWGFVIGGVFSFFVGQLIIQKSFRIFNRRMLTALIASAGAMIIVVAVFACDLLGVEKYVPDAEDVESIKIFDTGVYGEYYNILDEQNIADVISFHKEVITRKDELIEKYDNTTHAANDEYDPWKWLSITYNLKNGKVVRRSYSIPNSLAEACKLNDLYQSNEILGILNSLKNAEPQNMQVSVYLSNDKYAFDDDVFVNPLAEKYGAAFRKKYGDYYGMIDLSEEEKNALSQAFCSDLERIGLRNIEPYSAEHYGNVQIKITHPLEEYSGSKNALMEGSNNFRYFINVYDENGITCGIAEIFNFDARKEFTKTLEVLDGIFAARFGL